MTLDSRTGFDNLTTNHKVALALARQGIRVFPCHASDGPLDSDGKPEWKAKQPMPRIKWKEGATADPDIINVWWQHAPEALVGMPLTDRVILDPDQHDGGPDGIAAFDQLAKRYPGLLRGPWVQTPHGRHHHYRQPNPPLGNAQGALPAGINVRGVGGYVIAPGCVQPDGGAWVMHNAELPLPELPLAVIAMIKGIQPNGPDTADERQSSDDYNFNDMTYPADPREAAYLKAACVNAFDRIAQAAIGNRNNTLNTVAVKLGHFIPHLLNESEVIGLLTEAAIVAGLDTIEIGPTIRSGLSKGKSEPRQPFDDVVEEFWDGDIDGAPAPVPDRVYKGSELRAIPRGVFLIDGVIPQGGLGLMVGESQTFKSFLAQSMALAIATGQSQWEGHAIKAPPGAVVLYIAGEGGTESVAVRMLAWAERHGVKDEQLDRFRLIAWNVNLMDKSSFKKLVAAAKASINDSPLALIVLDTINTTASGAEENSTKEMGILYAIMRRLAQIFTTTIMGVHHTNKQGKTRGSNLLTQNADFWLLLSRPQRAWLTMNVELIIAKLKDAPAGAREHYHLDLVALPDTSTSLVPKRIGITQAEKTETTAMGRPSSRQEAILEVLRRSRSIDGESKSEICAIMDIEEMKEKRAVAQALRRMLAAGLVTRDGTKWQIVGDEGFFD